MVRLFKERMSADTRKWGPIRSYMDYVGPFATDLATKKLVVWDRAWPSEVVYSKLMKRDRPMEDNWWGLEWTFGLPVMTRGLRIMMLGPNADELKKRRDSTDLPCDPAEERDLFKLYAETFGWTVVQEYLDERRSNQIVEWAVETAMNEQDRAPSPLVFSGKADFGPDSKVFLEQKLAGPGPFRSPNGTAFARKLGYVAFQAGWANTDCPPEFLSKFGKLIPVDEKANEWAVKKGLTNVDTAVS